MMMILRKTSFILIHSLLDLLLVVRDTLLSQLQGTVACVMEELLTWFYFSVRGYTIKSDAGTKS